MASVWGGAWGSAWASSWAEAEAADLVVYSEILRASCPITLELSASSPITIARALITRIDLEEIA